MGVPSGADILIPFILRSAVQKKCKPSKLNIYFWGLVPGKYAHDYGTEMISPWSLHWIIVALKK